MHELTIDGVKRSYDFDEFMAVCMFCCFVGLVICGGDHEADHRGRTRAWCRWCHVPFKCDTAGREVLFS